MNRVRLAYAVLGPPSFQVSSGGIEHHNGARNPCRLVDIENLNPSAFPYTDVDKSLNADLFPWTRCGLP
jgi:hypothetical protein